MSTESCAVTLLKSTERGIRTTTTGDMTKQKQDTHHQEELAGK
jgi:hypothetical protein